jgi:hypothetical protein
VAEECERVLERDLPPATALARVDLPHYTLFTFRGPASAFEAAASSLEWNGHAMLGADISGGK